MENTNFDTTIFGTSRRFEDWLHDPTNPLVYCLLTLDGKEFIRKNSYSVELSQKTNDHDTFTITVPDDALDTFQGYVMENSKKLLGKDLTITYWRFGKIRQTFTGIIGKIRNKKDEGGGYGDLHITGFAPSILLENGKDCQSFENKTLEQIIKEVTEEYPQEAKVAISSNYLNEYNRKPLPYTVQYKESDYQFIKRLAIRHGEFFYYNGEKLMFGNDVQPILRLGENIDLIDIEFEMRMESQDFKYISYDAQSGARIEKDSSSIKSEFKESPFQSIAVIASGKVFKKKPKMHFNHTGIQDWSEGQLAEAVRLEKERRENLMQVRGKSKDPELKIGGRAELSDINSKAMETYRIIEIKHIYEPGDYYNEFVGIPDLFNASPFIDTEAVPKGEEQPARVVDNNDPMGMGRIRVQFPWQEDKGQKTPWIRLIQPHSGAGKGFHFIPEIGEEVLVGFESGNAEKPFVMGTHYNGSETSGYHTANNDLKAMHSRSNNKIVMNDSEKSLLLEDGSGSFFKMKGNRTAEINTDVLEINVRKLIINASQSTEITTNDYILNALSRIYIFSNFMKQHINGFMHLFSNKALINSINTIDIEAKEAKLHGTEKALVHSDKTALVNSKGTAEMHGTKGNSLTNKAKKATIAATEEIALANVYFRPLDSWNGEFGMDWLREKDNGLALATDPAYADIIEGGYNNGVTDLTGGATGTAYTQLKTQYFINPIKKKAPTGSTTPPPDGEYFVPYLSLFSEVFVATLPATLTVKPKYEVELKILVEIEEDIEKLMFEYDKNLFTIDKPELADKTKTTGLVNSVDTSIKITCKKDLDSDKEIKIYAYPKTVATGNVLHDALNSIINRKLAGRIIVLKNDATARKNQKFVLVPVITNIDSARGIKTGQFSSGEKQRLQEGLYQSIITSKLETGPTLDLSADTKFQVKTDAHGVKTYGDYTFENTAGSTTKTDGNINEDKAGIFSYVRNLYIAQNPIYAGYYIMFAFDENTYDSYYDSTTGSAGAVPGQVQNIKIKNVFLFNGIQGRTRGSDTIAHEGLHGLGLHHTHADSTPITESDRKYVFANGNDTGALLKSTDNIMSYGNKVKKSTWKWQWDIVRNNV